MKKLLFLLFLPAFVNAQTYYVSTTGNNSNPGTLAQPWATWDKANNVSGFGAGDTVIIRGGTYSSPYSAASAYHCLFQNKTGTAAAPIVIMAYPGETPILDLSTVGVPTRTDPVGLYIINCPYIKFKGLRVTGLKQICCNQGISRGMELWGCPNAVVEQVTVDNIGGFAFHIYNGSNNVLFKNCDAYNNADSESGGGGGQWGAGDGYGCTGGDNSTNTTYDGCRAWWCSDDGWDNFGTNATVTYKNCWSFWNGYQPNSFLPAGDGNGFKLGPTQTDQTNTTLRFLNNCLSFENRLHGFDQNGTPTTLYQLYNNTAYGNKGYGFQFQYWTQPPGAGVYPNVFKNNAALANTSGAIFNGGSNVNNVFNSWNGSVTISAADFQSVSSVGMNGPRQADGSLPVLPFMRLVAGSDLINAGTNVGLPFCQTAPDMGCYEYCPASTPPVSNAGVDQTITLPINQVTLSGSATTSGSISAWEWRKLTGGTAVISNPNVQTTTATSLVQGVCTFELKVTDNAGLTDTDTMQVTVNAAPLTPPDCNVGFPVSITLPINNCALICTANSTTGGSVVSYLWSKVSGPATFTILNGTTANATSTNLVAGTYVFRCTVTDNNALTCQSDKTVTVNAAPNQPPTSLPCCSQTITLPTSNVSLTGSGTDPDGTIVSYQWSQTGGIPVTITTPNSQNTTVTGFTTSGTYTINLKVTDNNGATGNAIVTITVNPLVVLPTATCAPNITITLPTNSCNLVGTSTGTQTPFSFAWTKLTGPSTFTLVTPTATQTQFTGLVSGTYTIEYKVTDNNGNIARDTMSVLVNPAPNQLPTSNPCCTQSITLPVSSVSLTGSGTDPDGTIVAWQWSQTQGIPVNIITPNSQNTTVNNFTIAGVYKFNLRVTDNNGGVGNAIVTITVNPAIVLPTCFAGNDTSITLPVNAVALHGIATGTGLSYLWTKLTGGVGTIANSTVLVTQAQNLVADTFTFELKVTDVNSNIARDTVQIIVYPNTYPPIVSAGADQQLFTPTSSTTLTGSAILTYGTVSSWSWVQVSGAASTITNPFNSSTTITGLTLGTYKYSLTVTTSDGWVVSDSVTIIIYDPAVIPGFQWYMATIVNGKANISWIYNGATAGTNFIIQKKSWWWFNDIATIAPIKNQNQYSYIDNKTSSGTSTYRIRYGSSYSGLFSVKKK